MTTYEVVLWLLLYVGLILAKIERERTFRWYHDLAGFVLLAPIVFPLLIADAFLEFTVWLHGYWRRFWDWA